MSYKLIQATAARTGTTILIEGNVCTVRSNDISKSGKHGASKCRIEAIGILDGKKRVIAVPGSERFEVPMVQKCKGQILSMSEGKASLMDLESFETIEVTLGEDNEEEIHEGDSVEYWDVEGVKVIKRKI